MPVLKSLCSRLYSVYIDCDCLHIICKENSSVSQFKDVSMHVGKDGNTLVHNMSDS